jgi:uncharacterized phage protein gp47/JayE
MATVDDTGLTTRTKEEIETEIRDAWAGKPALGADFLTSDDTPQSQIAEPTAEAAAQIEEALAALIGAFSRSTATGQWLDDAGDRIGVPRLTATKSTVTATVNLNAGVLLPTGSQAADSTDETEVYETLADVENTGGSAADFQVACRAVVAGSGTFVTAGQLTEIVTPVTGWNSVTNAADAAPGQDQEADAPYRIRQAESLSRAGASTADALISDMLLLDGITSVAVLENPDSYVVDSLPPHSFETLVGGGDEDEIAQVIWDNQPSGIRAMGSDSGTAVDVQGADRTVRFSRPTDRGVYVDITLTTDATYVGDVAFKEALILAAQSAFGLGDDVIYAKLYALAFAVTGVTDVPALAIAFTASPVATSNLPISSREIATWATDRITIS